MGNIDADLPQFLLFWHDSEKATQRFECVAICSLIYGREFAWSKEICQTLPIAKSQHIHKMPKKDGTPYNNFSTPFQLRLMPSRIRGKRKQLSFDALWWSARKERMQRDEVHLADFPQMSPSQLLSDRWPVLDYLVHAVKYVNGKVYNLKAQTLAIWWNNWVLRLSYWTVR